MTIRIIEIPDASSEHRFTREIAAKSLIMAYALGLLALLVAARVDARRSVNCPADCKLTIHKFFLNRQKRRAPPPPDTQRLIDVASSWTQLPQFKNHCNVTIKLWSYEEALAEARRYDPRSAAAPES